MSVKALTWAFEQPISATEKVVLLALADHANEHGLCWPSVSTLMKRANVGERTVQRAIQSLEEGGFITRERRSRENGSDTSNLYRLMFERTSTETCGNVRKPTERSGGVNLAPHTDTHPIPMPKGIETHKEGDVIQTGGVTQTGGEGVIQTGGEGGLHDTPRTVIKNHQIEPSISYDAEFAEFWAAYPSRQPHSNPKVRAKEKYIHLRRKENVSHETIVNGAKAYAIAMLGRDTLYIAQAVTWLNQRRFEDDYPVAGGTSGQQSAASDEDINKLAKVYPGHIGDRERAKKLLAAEMAKGVKIDEICLAAEKYSLFCKGPPYEDRRITPSMMEPWLQFKWREMDAYEFCRVGADRIRTVRPIKVGK